MKLAVDVVVLGLDDGRLDVLTVERARPPFAGSRALPGSQVGPDEDLEQAATRVLFPLIGNPPHLEQLATFGAPRRDPRGRVVSVTYLALVPAPLPVAEPAAWCDAVAPGRLAFDHATILATAVERLRGKLSYSNVAYGLLPDEFTLSELQAVYEGVLGRALDKRNFRKKLTAVGLLEEAGGQRRGSHRPAQLYRFTHRSLVLLDNVITS